MEVTDEFPKLNGSLGSGFIGHSRSVSTTRVYTKIRQNSAIDRLVDWCSGYHVCFTKSVQISTLFISQQVPGSIPGSIIFCFFRVSFYFFFLLSFWLWTPHFFLPTRSCLIFVVSHTILHKSITISILYERPPTFDQKVSAQVGLVVRLSQRIWKTATLCSMQRLGSVKA